MRRDTRSLVVRLPHHLHCRGLPSQYAALLAVGTSCWSKIVLGVLSRLSRQHREPSRRSSVESLDYAWRLSVWTGTTTRRNRMRVAFGLAAGALLFASSATAFAQPPMVGAGGQVDLETLTGESVGSATLMNEAGGTRLKVQVKGLPPGPHGIHIHETGQCNPPDFMSAGGHYNPTNKQHGLNNPQGAHAGDMPNLTVGADGT